MSGAGAGVDRPDPSRPALSDGVVWLRPLELDDVDAHLAGEDGELRHWLTGGSGNSRAGVEAQVRRELAAWAAGGATRGFGIRVRSPHVGGALAGAHAGGALAATVLAGTIEAQLGEAYLEPGQANLAYGLYPAWRGRGLASRAVRLLCAHLAATGAATEAVIRVDPANPASAAVAVRTGFRYLYRALEPSGELDWYVRALDG